MIIRDREALEHPVMPLTARLVPDYIQPLVKRQ
jgi:hypothetical protein